MAASKYRAVYGLRHGHLHQALGVTGREIPEEKLEAAQDSSNEHVKEMAKVAKKHLKAQVKIEKKSE
jgi:hypothetical protein